MKSTFALLLYRLLFLFLLPVILLLLVIRSKNNPAYRQRLTERLGLVPSELKSGGIIIHAASVGEVIAIKAFVNQLLTSRPDEIITITTFTPTGSAQVQKLFGNKVQHCYFPLDVFFCSWLFLNKMKPKALVVMETELWPNITAQASNRNIKLLLINARLSQKSVKSYQKLTALIKPCINSFDNILCQSQDNLDNYLKLGANPQTSAVSGNLKFDISHNPETEDKIQQLSKYLTAKRKVWLVASSHPGDEELVLTSFKEILKQDKELLLLLVPRHPERFAQVAKLCQQNQLTTVKRSENTNVNESVQVWLLDSLGELMAAYALADVVTIAGSFSTIGGHNPLEAALYKKPIIVGPDMANFSEVFHQLEQESGVKQIAQQQSIAEVLATEVSQLLQNSMQADTLGKNAYKVVLANQGASSKTVEQLSQLISG